MATDSWINETLYPDWGQRFLVKRELARVRSAFQDIVVFESFSHGRVMVLDGVIQITERDEFVYQEMLTHVPLLAHGDARHVLIIGAGDGGVLRRVLQHSNVRRAVMAEIDGEVADTVRKAWYPYTLPFNLSGNPALRVTSSKVPSPRLRKRGSPSRLPAGSGGKGLPWTR